VRANPLDEHYVCRETSEANDPELVASHVENKLFEAYGIVQKEYVQVHEELLAATDELRPYFEISFEYAKTLKPKPTKR